MHTWVPALLAVAAAFLIAGGTVLRQRASTASGAIGPGWWLGAGIAVAGFGLQASALGLGPILLVQPLLVLAVLFALPMEAWADHRHPGRREWAWGGALVVCVVTFLAVARPEASHRRPDDLLIVTTVAVVVGFLLLCVFIAERSQAHYRSLFYGLAAGALFGISALLIKTVIFEFRRDFLGTFLRPELYLLIVVATAAVVAQQKGFGAGDLQTSFPAMNVMEPAVAMMLGIVLLGENLDVPVPVALLLGIILAVMVRAVVELARLSAVRSEQLIVQEPVLPPSGGQQAIVTERRSPVDGRESEADRA